MRSSVDGVLASLTDALSPFVDELLKSVTPDLRLPSQPLSCDWYKLYSLVTKTHACEQLAQGRYLTAELPEVELVSS